jgi:predicted Zn-dependent protease
LNLTATPVWRRLLAASLASLMALSAPAQTAAPAAAPGPGPGPGSVRLPALGESAYDDLTVGAERRMGEQIMREIRVDPDYLDDPVLLEYLQSLWNPLVAAARQQGNVDPDIDRSFAWEAFLVHDRSVNAFALPGGYVGVHLGLIALTSSRDQLASVLAHELSHVTQRHIARSIAPAQHASMLALAAILLGILAASRSNNADIANATIMGGQGAAAQSQLNFSRDVEREADRMGYGVLAAAGFATSGMAGMFEKLDTASRLNDAGGFPYLRSHPLTVDRISEARNRTLLAGSAPPGPPLQHALMQMRARVLMDTNPRSLERLTGSTSSPLRADRLAALYGGAMAATLLGQHARAAAQVADAVQLASSAEPREPLAERELQLLQVQVQLARGDAAGALQTLDALPAEASPGASPRPALLLRGQVALDLQRQRATVASDELRRSTEALQTWLAEHTQDAAAWQMVAATSDALGYRLRALRSGAEARAAAGDLSGAIDRMRAAQAAARSATGPDFIEASVIDTRLRQLLGQRRQIALEARGGRGGPEEPTPQ